MQKTLSEPARPHPLETDVQRFIHEQNLAPHIAVAMQLVATGFSSALGVTMERKVDPEFADEWVTIKVQVAGDVDSALRAYNAVTKQLCAKIPEGFGRKIRLSLGF